MLDAAGIGRDADFGAGAPWRGGRLTWRALDVADAGRGGTIRGEGLAEALDVAGAGRGKRWTWRALGVVGPVLAVAGRGGAGYGGGQTLRLTWRLLGVAGA